VFHNERRGQILLTAVFDNLGKGASGAAVQNLALMLGLEV
jgi:N-acetyl-gamma-glutamyl-phosphate reductase